MDAISGERRKTGETKVMISAIIQIAEHRISEAMKLGMFDNLPCQGKPLDLDGEMNIPQELRMAYTLLKNGGYLDDGSQSKNFKEMTSLETMLRHNPEERLKVRKMRKLTVMEYRINNQFKRKLEVNSERYFEKVVEKIIVADKEKKHEPV